MHRNSVKNILDIYVSNKTEKLENLLKIDQHMDVSIIEEKFSFFLSKSRKPHTYR